MLWSEVKKLTVQIAELAKKQGVEVPLQQVANQAIEIATPDTVKAAIIFLTPKQKTIEITDFLKWVGVHEELENELVFGGTMTLITVVTIGAVNPTLRDLDLTVDIEENQKEEL